MGINIARVAVMLGFFVLLLPAVQAESLSPQQASFLQAEKALKSGNSARYRKLKDSLSGYSLIAYLDYAEASRSLADSNKVERNLELNSDTYLADKLRYRWLK